MGNEFPRKPYTEVESEHVREAIRDGDFDDVDHRRYVNDLVAIEEYVLDGPSGFASGMHHAGLRRKHPADYDAIQLELDPEAYRDRRQRETERRVERRVCEEQRANERAEKRRISRETWKEVSESG